MEITFLSLNLEFYLFISWRFPNKIKNHWEISKEIKIKQFLFSQFNTNGMIFIWHWKHCIFHQPIFWMKLRVFSFKMVFDKTSIFEVGNKPKWGNMIIWKFSWIWKRHNLKKKILEIFHQLFGRYKKIYDILYWYQQYQKRR